MQTQTAIQEHWNPVEGEFLSESQRIVAERILGHHRLFSALNDHELQRMVNVIKLFEVEEQQFLIRQYDASNYLFVLFSGQMKIAVVSVEGAEKVLDIVDAGNTLMEHTLFGDQPYISAAAQALTECRLYGIPRVFCQSLFKDNSEFAMRLVHRLCKGVDERIGELVSLSQKSATHRAARYLLNLLPGHAEDGHTLYLRTPKQVIASKLSIKPETLSRIMSEMTLRQLIQVKGRSVCIKNISGLSQLA